MSGHAGTRALLRLALRLDRVRLPVWVLLLAVMPAVTATQYLKLYPTAQSRELIAGVVANPSLIALNGPLFDSTSIGGLTAWKIGVTNLILVGLMNVLTVIRHTRTEEEAGRSELLGAGAVGRSAPLTAALLCAGLADLTTALLIALGLVGVGMPAGGSVALGLVIGAVGLLFAAVAAVAAQLTASARTATAIAAAVLGGSYLLRAIGDAGPTWLSWLSPVGWGLLVRPFAAERWWLLRVIAVLACALMAVAYVLVGRRDLGAGLLPQRPGPAQAPAGLRSPLALAWRLNRGMLLGWLVGMVLAGATLGGAANGIGAGFTANQQLSDLLARLGGSKGIVDAYLAAVFAITGLVAAAYTVQATLRLHAEEAAGRLEPLLATRVGRIRWALSNLVFALLGTAVLLAAAGAAGGLAYGLEVGDVGGQVSRLLAAALVQVPAAWVLAGLGAALFGLAPRLTVLTWAGLIGCLLLLEVGALLGLDQWLIDASPFAHVPKLPGSAFTIAPLLWLTGIALALGAAGLAGFRRRDIG
jgi:ABC-2 type transport system permease protein